MFGNVIHRNSRLDPNFVSEKVILWINYGDQ